MSYGSAGVMMTGEGGAGMEGTTRPEGQADEEVIFVGIIDTLVPFRWRKKTEYYLKVSTACPQHTERQRRPG